MRIRPAQEPDAPAMGHLMVDTFLEAHKGQLPEGAWRKRRKEWTYEDSQRGWARELRSIHDDPESHTCIFLAVAPGIVLIQAEWDIFNRGRSRPPRRSRALTCLGRHLIRRENRGRNDALEKS